jgi:predicted alpha-1,2-mannosidase
MHQLNGRKLLSLFTFCTFSMVAAAQDNAGTGNLRYVDPIIGNVGQLLEPTRPTIQLPHQMVRMYPMREDYKDDQISSFPLEIVSHRMGGVFAVKPTVQPVSQGSWRAKMPYDNDLEVTRPWFYSTWLLDDEISVSFVPGKKTGIYHFDFPAGSKGSLLLYHYNDGDAGYAYTNNELTGVETWNDIKIYLYGKFNAGGTFTQDGKRAYISFPNSKGTVELRYGISFISAAQAKKNFEEELANTSFDQLRESGEKAWASVINQISVKGGTEAQKRSFYTALYRTNERMVDITEDGQYYSGYDNKIHTADRPFYVDDWTWDTYLANHPLRAILQPAMEEDMMESYVHMYEQSGWMPTFPVLYGDHACMNGFHSSVMLLDGYRKGLRNFDAAKAYEGMYKNATAATMIPWRNGPKTVLDDFYYEHGYFPALHPGEKETVPEVQSFEKRQAVAVTLGGAYDDWAVGEMAKELGKNDDYKKFHARSYNYKNLWDTAVNMFMPKDGKGAWINIDPKFDGGMGGRDYYDENNGWTYLWQVQEDIPGLVDLMGGKKKFENRLDQLFREGLGRSRYEFNGKFPDATGLVGQFSMGNEPSFHIPYLYNFSGAPWKTQKRIRFLLDVWFKDNIFGIPGDEDGGGMTAFVVFSSLGFYPITPGLPVYTIGSPLFEESQIALPNGKTFKVIAHNCSVVNKYIQSAKMDGKALNVPFFSHAQLVAGGTLELEMGPKPNKAWGVE